LLDVLQLQAAGAAATDAEAFAWWDDLSMPDGCAALEVVATAIPFALCRQSLERALTAVGLKLSVE